MPIHVIASLLTGNGSLFIRLDQVFSYYPAFLYIFLIELVLGGCLSEAFYKLAPTDLLFPEYLTPSPGERNLQTRFSLNMAPWVLILFIYAALGVNTEQAIAELEREFILDALQRNDWNVTRAALEVNIQRPNFQALMRKHAIRAGRNE